jgi:AAA15 family ATPase/GTPase
LLIRLEIENFYSIKHRQVLDLRVPRTAPAEQRFVELLGTSGIRIPKVVALFGANASGKTTVLRAISFLVAFATRSFNENKPNDSISILPFAAADTRAGSTKLAMEFMPFANPSRRPCRAAPSIP